MADHQAPGRKANEAETPGTFTALGGEKAVQRTGERAREKAGPDGGDAKAVGDTFKNGPQADE